MGRHRIRNPAAGQTLAWRFDSSRIRQSVTCVVVRWSLTSREGCRNPVNGPGWKPVRRQISGALEVQILLSPSMEVWLNGQSNALLTRRRRRSRGLAGSSPATSAISIRRGSPTAEALRSNRSQCGFESRSRYQLTEALPIGAGTGFEYRRALAIVLLLK